MFMKNTKLTFLIFIIGCLGDAFWMLPPVRAAVEYCAATETIWVSDYPADFPCTPRLLARIDKTFGWGRVYLDEGNSVVTVAANLMIGRNDGSSTYFQIGDPKHTNETLIVQGSLRVYPNWLTGENRELHPGKPTQLWMLRQAGLVNRLTLGVRDDPNIHAALLLEKHPRGPAQLTIGGFFGYSSKNAGGQLLVYNSMIASAGDDPIETVNMGVLDRLEMINATVRNVRREWGRLLGSGLFQNCRFEKCGVAITGYYQDKVNAVSFIDCGTAVSVARDGVLYDCVFSGNRRNWSLNHNGRLVAVDCEIDAYDKGAYSGASNAFFVSKRHVIVRTLDRAGNPLKNAAVQVQLLGAERVGAPEFDNLQAVTGTDGRTPGREAKGALLLSERLLRAGADTNAAPEQTEYVYAIHAKADGREAQLGNFTPRRSWEEVALVVE
jgi:hypothetical protein